MQPVRVEGEEEEMKTRSMFKRLAVIVAVAATTVSLVTLGPTKHLAKVYGSDHREAPTVDGLPEGDLTDVYTFTDPNDSSRVDFIMNVNSFAVPGENGSYAFSPDMLYQFKIDNTGDAREDLVIQVKFDTTGQTQTASIYGPAAPTVTGARNTLLSGTPTTTAKFGVIPTVGSGVTAFVGLRDDPFVFDFAQFTRILNGSQDLFRAVGTSFRGRAVRADGTSGVNTFGGFNLTTIAVSVPKSAVRGSTSKINVWATVSQLVPARHGANVYQQFERQGQQAFATIFIPSGAARDAENFEIPEHDVANYSSLLPDALTTMDTDGTNNTISGRASLLTSLGVTAFPNGQPLLLPATFPNTDKNLLREAVLPDVLRLDLDVPYGTLNIGVGGLQNGRILDYDDIDVYLQLVRQLADVQFPAGAGIPGSGPLGTRAALDCTEFPQCGDRRVLVVLQGTQFIKADSDVPNNSFEGNDEPFLASFPYIANPHPLPGAPGTTDFPTQQDRQSTSTQ